MVLHIQHWSVDTTHLRAGAVCLSLSSGTSTWTVRARAGDFVAQETALGVFCVVYTTAHCSCNHSTIYGVTRSRKLSPSDRGIRFEPRRFYRLPSGLPHLGQLPSDGQRLQSKSLPTHQGWTRQLMRRHLNSTINLLAPEFYI